MEGFDSSPAPVYLKVDEALGYGSGFIAIDGSRARWSNGGLIVNIGDTRHWVPISRILEIKQDQPPIVQAPPPQGG